MQSTVIESIQLNQYGGSNIAESIQSNQYSRINTVESIQWSQYSGVNTVQSYNRIFFFFQIKIKQLLFIKVFQQKLCFGGILKFGARSPDEGPGELKFGARSPDEGPGELKFGARSPDEGPGSLSLWQFIKLPFIKLHNYRIQLPNLSLLGQL